MRLLVTRPQPGADSSAARIHDAGHEPVVYPLIAPHFLPLAGKHEAAALIVTSQNGVRAMQRWPQMPGWIGLPLFAVGDTTATAARTAGFGDVRSADGDAEALAELIAAGLSPSVGPLLYAAARDRSSVLEDRLRAAGFAVDAVVVYRMDDANSLGSDLAAEIGGSRLDGAVFYSRRSALVFLDLLDNAGLADALGRWSIFVLSPQIAEVFADRAVGRIEVADTPREDALMKRLPTAR